MKLSDTMAYGSADEMMFGFAKHPVTTRRGLSIGGVVVDGGCAAFVGPRGLVRAPLTTCTTAWRID